MGRPIKQGLSYFPLDVDVDDKIELIEAKHGIVGFGIVIKLFQKIYKEGYFLLITEELLLLISKRINVNINLINDIINDAIKYDIFDKEMYENYKILTSNGIQKRFIEATERRKKVELIKEFLINVDINKINVIINPINAVISTQSKVKKSKVKKSRALAEGPPDFINQILDIFIEEHGSYEIMAKGKERSAIGIILKKYKSKYPAATSEETLKGLREYFKMCINVPDVWLMNNMSPSIIVSKFNEINKILKNGTGKKTGATPYDIAEAVAKNFAVDFEEHVK